MLVLYFRDLKEEKEPKVSIRQHTSAYVRILVLYFRDLKAEGEQQTRTYADVC
jgi:hypothetical protein